MADATWEGDVSGNYNDGLNWDTTTVPDGTATFGATGATAITVSGPTSVGGWTFDTGAQDYTFSVTDFSFTGAGIVINGGSATIANDYNTVGFYGTSSAGSANIDSNNGATLNFNDNSSAGSAAITNGSRGVSLSSTFFGDDSTAGSATITNYDSGQLIFGGNSTADSAQITNVAGVFGGVTRFGGNSTAGSAQITNDGLTDFRENSTADNASITNYDRLAFFGTSDAGSATITNFGGSRINFNDNSTAGDAQIDADNGELNFNGNSTAGNAQITTNGGWVDFSLTSGPLGDGAISAGSIAGAGHYRLGPNHELTVGSNNLSTVVSGTIEDGGFGGGGALIKVGTGTLTLSGINSYTGGTTVNQGTLQVDGSIASVTQVNNGGTLSGNGLTHGGVHVMAGGTLSPGAGGAGVLHVYGGDVLAFAAGSMLDIELGGATPGSGYDLVTVNGPVNLGGATLLVSLINGFHPSTAVSQNFTIINGELNDAISGSFAGLAEGAQFVRDGRFFTITYKGGDGNDVVC